MRLEITNLDEKALPKTEQHELYQVLNSIRELSKQLKPVQDQPGADQVMNEADIESQLMLSIKKLVDNSLWRAPKIALSSIADIFNVVGERLEKWQEIKSRDELILLLTVASILVNKTSIDTSLKIENIQDMLKLVQKSEDVLAIALAIDITNVLNNKKIAELGDKISFFALGNNLLRNQDHHFSLSDYGNGLNANSESLKNSDLIFDYEIQPLGLNERTTTKTVVIKNQDIVASPMTAVELSQDIANQYNKGTDEKFKLALEVKIILSRYITSDQTLKDAFLLRINSLLSTTLYKMDTNNQLLDYLKDKFIAECIQIITQWSDVEMIVKAIQAVFKSLTRDQLGIINLEPFLKLNRPDPSSDQEEIPLIVSLLNDITVVKEAQSEDIMHESGPHTKLINIEVAQNSDFQLALLNVVFQILRQTTSQNNRQSQVQIELVASIVERLIRIVEQIPPNFAYSYSIKVQQLACTLLKTVIRSRHEEQLNIVSRFEKKILYELENLDTKFSYKFQDGQVAQIEQKDRQQVLRGLFQILAELTSRDVANVGIGRKVMESQILNKIGQVTSLNTEESGHLVDDFIIKYILLVGAICSEAPANVPALIKNGVIPDILKSLENRLPNSSDMLTGLTFTMYQITLNQEGQDLFKSTTIFAKIIESAMDEKLCKQVIQCDHLQIRQYLCNIYDRNTDFKEITKQVLNSFIVSIKDIAYQLAIKSINISRQKELAPKERQSEIAKLKDDPALAKVQGGLFMIQILSVLQNDRMNQSRHTTDIITEEIFQQLLEIFEVFAITEIAAVNTTISKIFKFLSEQQNIQSYVKIYVDSLKASIGNLSLLLGGQLQKLKNLDSLKQNDNIELADIQQFKIDNKQSVLTKIEQFVVQIKIIEQYVRTFLTIPSATKQIIISSFDFIAEMKTLFYFQKVLMSERSNLFAKKISLIEQDEENQELTAYKQALLSDQEKELSKEELQANNAKIQEFMDTYLDNESLVAKRDLVMFDFINKISSYSAYGSRSSRSQNRQDVQKKNCIMIGRFIYKLTKALKGIKFAKIPTDINNKQLLKYFYDVQTVLVEINNCLNKRQLDGIAFYEFYKAGGLTNIFEVFGWLTGMLHKIDSTWQRAFQFLFEDSCSKIKEILVGIILLQKIDQSQNAFLEITMTNEFDSPKHFFSNVFNSFCTQLLPLSQQEINPLINTYKENFLFLQEVIIQLLVWASIGFNHCVYIKESQRAAERGRARNQVDPVILQSLVDLGFSRDAAQAALLQYGTLEQAADHLLMNAGSTDNFMNVIEELNRVSSDDSDEQPGVDVVNYEAAIIERKERIEKVSIDIFKDTVRKAQDKGFDWMLEAQKQDKVSNLKAKEFISNTILSEKEREQQQKMFRKLSEILRSSLISFQENIIKDKFSQQLPSNEIDQEMTDSKNNAQSKEQGIITKLYQDLQLIQKVIIKEKAYSKESIRQDVYRECIGILDKLLNLVQGDVFLQWNQNKVNNSSIQVLVFELLLLIFTMIQYVSLYITASQNEIQKKGKALSAEDIAVREKKHKEFKIRVNTTSVFEICLKILNIAIANQQKEGSFQIRKPIILLSIVLLLKGVNDADVQKEKRTDLIAQAFQILSKIKVNEGIDIKLITSFALFSFQEPQVNQQAYEKLIQKVLALKLEDTSEQYKKQNKVNTEGENSLSTIPYPQFCSYFKVLVNKDKKAFQMAFSNSCEVKATKKQGKINQEGATVKIKEQVWQDLVKQQQKERPLLKQLVKLTDSQTDSQLKKQIKSSKTQLQQQCTEEQNKTLHVLLNTLYESTSIEISSINSYFDLQSQKKPLIIEGEIQQNSVTENFKILELLANLTMAYPSTTLTILQYQFPNKKSFTQWLIQDFIICYLLKKINTPLPLEEGQQVQKYEVSYEFQKDLSAIDDQIAKALNLITGYNHLLNINEIIIKNEIRQKLVLESLTNLQKTIKTKKNIFPLKQRAILASNLTIIYSLISFDTINAGKLVAVSKENYYNSIRTLIVRDSSSSQQMPPSFIKIANELISDTLDVTSKLNAEIIRKTISIFKVFSDFIISQKKKIKAKEKDQKPLEENLNIVQQEELKENVEMLSDSQSNQDHDNGEMENVEQEEEHDDNESEDDDDQEEQEDEGEQEQEDDEESMLEDNFNQVDEQEDEQYDYPLGEDDENLDMQDEMESDDEEIVIDANLGDRRVQQDIVMVNERDIINALSQQQLGLPHRRMIFQENRQAGRQNDWTQEEQEVQSLLISMRGMISQHNLQNRRGADQLVRQGRQQEAATQNMIEQIYENLNMITEQEIIELVLRQRQKMEPETQLRSVSPALDMQIPPLIRRDVMQPIIDFNMNRLVGGNEDAQLLNIQERLGDIQFLLSQHNNALVDPLYGRPMAWMGGNPAPNAQTSLVGGPDLGLFNRLLRNALPVGQENANEQLLENIDVQIVEEEEKKEEVKEGDILKAKVEQAKASAEQQEQMQRQVEEMAQQREALMRQHNQFQQSFNAAANLQPLDSQQMQVDSQLLLNLSNSLLEQQQQNINLPSTNEQQPIPSEASNLITEAVQNQSPVEVQPLVQDQNVDQPMEVVQQNNEPVVPLQNEQLPAAEENKQEIALEEQKQQPVEEVPSASGTTFGYDNALLLANDIDPAILHELPEDVRAELLSSIDQQVQQQLQQTQEAQDSVSSLADPVQANAEESKNNASQQQQQVPQQQQNEAQSNYAQIASELGLDPTFLESIPEEFRRELIDNELMRHRNLGGQQQVQQPHREAEQMDLASFIATVTDPNLRAEILSGLDEATLATLPPNLMAEARRLHDQVRSDRYERILVRQMMEGGHAADRAGGRGGIRAPGGRIRDPHNAEAIFGRNMFRGDNDYEQQRAPGESTLEQVILKRHREIADEQDNDDSASSLQAQLGSDEKLIDSLLIFLCGNENTDCELIPLLDSLIKIQNSNGQLAIRNKIINAVTFLLKSLALNEEESINIMLPNTSQKKNKIALILIGTLRIMIKSNKKLIQHILKGLINKDEYYKQQGNHVLKRQQKAAQVLKNSQQNQSSLADIFFLVKTEMFKNDKTLMKNLSILIHQILKQFDAVIEDLGGSSQQISKESVESLAEILSLEIIDYNLMSALGEFLYQISKRKKSNFDLISEYCENRSKSLLDRLNNKLESIGMKYENLKVRMSPTKSVSASDLGFSQADHNSGLEEEKSQGVQIDTSAVQTQVKHLKLSDEEEKSLKQALKINEDSEILLRIFKLFNLFYEKFSSQANDQIKIDETQEAPQKEDVIMKVKGQYSSQQVHQFVMLMNDVLRIISNANIEITDTISNLIFCVFATFFPEVFESINLEENKAGEEQNQNKFNVTMIPIGESLAKNHAEKFVLFKKLIVITPRIQDLSNFCQRNKKIINKLIKTKNNLFINEMEGLIKHMPNLLDFENKRFYFKQELAKLKKNQYYEQIHLFIRRDDIFMDSYAQLNIRTAAEMKGKLHISFTGERGQDAGGLTRDFFIELSREMFNPNYSLFNLSSNGSAYFPNPRSYVEKDHLRYFKFIGRVIGKSLFDECLLECYFVKSLYKVMTGEALNFYDLEDFDNEFFNNLKWCLENDVDPLQATFSIEQDFFGKTEELELKEGGKKIGVTNTNKNEYVEKLTYFKLYKNIQKQIDAFLEGFYELIPKELVTIFNYKELELLISGLPNFDIEDLKVNTEYQGYQANSPQVQWLWEILETFENSDRAEFLQFVTGSSKVPVEGFRGLMGMRGPQKFTIAKIKTDDILRLPSGHTCFNQIDIPEYPSKEIMHERVLVAIKETKGFGFA